MGYEGYDLEIAEGLESLQKFLDGAVLTHGKHVSPDKKLYRYMSKDRFLDMIENRRFTFAHVSLWEDPFEGFLFKSPDCNNSLRHMYAGFYGQSWTLECRESDIRWRAYCPKGDGVRIETTVGRLQDLMSSVFHPDFCNARYVCSPILYVQERFWKHALKNQALPVDTLFPRNRMEMSRLLFLKRMLFKSEDEYRVIAHIGHSDLCGLSNVDCGRFERKDGLLRCQMKFGIEAIVKRALIDPRMSLADIDRLKCRLLQASCNLEMTQSAAYRWPEFTVDKERI